MFGAIDVDAILVSDSYNMRYISNFTGGEGYLVITRDKNYIIVDSRYTVQAKEETKNYEVIEVSSIRNYFKVFQTIVDENNIKRFGFENKNISYDFYNSLRENVKVLEWVHIDFTLDDLRMVKRENELVHLRRAEQIGDIAFGHILGFIRPGVTELQVAAELEYRMKLEGAEDLSFNTIVASGLNSAKPHAVPQDKTIEEGDFVTMDFGCKYKGYCSDMTRTIVIGKASEKQKEIYNVVLEAQMMALDSIRAGMSCEKVDMIARDIIANAGYGNYFGHSLGHGVGLYIHENPRLSKGVQRILEENMVVTIEPGIYIEGFGGVRIEDMVVVKNGKCENLTHSSKKLIEIRWNKA